MSRALGIENQPFESTPALPTAIGSLGRDEVTSRIRARAHQFYVDRQANGGSGDALSDWLKAEREVQGALPRAQPTRPAGDDNSLVVVESRHRARGEALLRDREE
jgi:hypothetical protein